MSTVRVVNLQHPDSVEPNVILNTDGTATFASGVTVSGFNNISVSGTAVFASGNAASPSLTVEDDEDTGVFFPAGNEVAITTSGTQRLRVDDIGNVGIGTTSPDARLEVQGRTTTGSIAAHIKGGDGASTVGLIVDGDDEAGDVLIKARSNSTANPTDSDTKFIVEGSGTVGIGTTSPESRLHVSEAGAPGGILLTLDNVVNAAGVEAGLRIRQNSTDQLECNLLTDRASTNAGVDFKIELSDGVGTVTERFRISEGGNVGIGTSSPSATLDVNGSLSKNSGSFKIDHPLPALAETHYLVHSFVEAPDAFNLYAGMVDLVDGRATVNIDTAHRMTEGTFEALNNIQSWSSSNESGYAPVKCSISGNLLTIECQDSTSTDTVYYEVRGVRKDKHMLDTEWTDENGRVITEPLKPVYQASIEETDI